MESRRVRVIGVGPGHPDQVTLAAVAALREVDYFLVTDRSERGGMPDPLVNARDRLLDRHLERPPVVVRVADPEVAARPDRSAPQAEYDAAVARWHQARQDAVVTALLAHEGVAGFLVWGDPAFYDSTVPILRSIHDSGRLRIELDVVPGISSVQLLAARHGIALQEVGEPLHVTSSRALGVALAAGQENVVVMLNRVIELPGLDDWSIWWGANLGTPHEELVAGRVATALPEIDAARERVRERAGWIMDVFLLRRGR